MKRAARNWLVVGLIVDVVRSVMQRVAVWMQELDKRDEDLSLKTRMHIRNEKGASDTGGGLEKGKCERSSMWMLKYVGKTLLCLAVALTLIKLTRGDLESVDLLLMTVIAASMGYPRKADREV
jgi:hypothetical protein